MVSKIQLKGLTCQACQKVVAMKVKKVSGVQQVDVDLKTQLALVTADRTVSASEVREALSGTDYEVIN